jgi:hypothetical protein
MATTDSRTGFRLPWSTDRAASRETTAEPAESVPGEAATATDPGAPPAPESAQTTIQDAAGDAVPGQEEEPVTILAPDAASHPLQGELHADEAVRPTEGGPTAETGLPAPADSHAPADRPSTSAPARRPTKFLADLTRAMQAAAEQARTATLEQFRADGTTVIEQIHGRSATGATELRRRADDDVASIKEWSKAEIARIREETEQRISARREQLEGQLERHAALVEHEIERVRGSITAFESEMGSFFDDLQREEDPALFAARAASLPEAPSFGDFDDDALAALLREPGIGTPEPAPEPSIEASVEVDQTAPVAEAGPFDREAAMAAIQAAAEAAASLEAAELAEVATTGEVAVSDAESPAESPEAEAVAEVQPEAPQDAEPEAATEVETNAVEPAEVAADAPSAPEAEASPASPDVDPRLAMLGLTSDFAVAEAEAAEAAAAEVDDIPEIGGDALAARLAGLVPNEAPGASAETVTTQVMTTGLVSVASIASFKRHLGRLAGVAHVGVSSGPDGEFVFAVEHDAATSLRDLIPTIPGFAARVVGSGDGVVQVSAQDPQD